MGCGNMVLHGESHMKGSQNERFTTELSNEALYQFFNIFFFHYSFSSEEERPNPIYKLYIIFK